MWLNPLPHYKILDWPKLKAFTDNKINITDLMISLPHRLENIVGKGENASYQHFLLFPQCIQVFFPRVVKSRDCVVKS